MTIRAIVADVSAWLENVSTSLFQSKPAENPPQAAGNPKIDTYSGDFRAQLARNAFGEGAASSVQAWNHQSPLLYSPWGLVAIAGCGGEPEDYKQGGPTYSNNNNPPEIVSPNQVSIAPGSQLKFVVETYDEDGDEVTVKATTPLPKGADLYNTPKGLELRWTPTEDQLGEFVVSFVATDEHGSESEKYTLTIKVLKDNDGDGFLPDVDCNDNDESVFPLKNVSYANIVSSSVTICPGTYQLAGLTIKSQGGANPITVKGDGVIINDGYIEIVGSGSAEISGFQLNENSAPSAYAVHVKGFNNTLRNMVFNGYGDGIYIDNCDSTKVSNIKMYNLGVFIKIDGGQINTIENCYFQGAGMLDGWDSSALELVGISHGNEIKNNVLKGVGISIGELNNWNTISANKITNNNLSAGIEVYGDNNQISTNSSNNNRYGIQIHAGACDNNVSGNDFTGNSTGPINQTSNPGCTNDFWGNTPNQ